LRNQFEALALESARLADEHKELLGFENEVLHQISIDHWRASPVRTSTNQWRSWAAVTRPQLLGETPSFISGLKSRSPKGFKAQMQIMHRASADKHEDAGGYHREELMQCENPSDDGACFASSGKVPWSERKHSRQSSDGSASTCAGSDCPLSNSDYEDDSPAHKWMPTESDVPLTQWQDIRRIPFCPSSLRT
jgi:hypothetical protein